jgi:RHS repeat-associated protein
LLKHIKECGNTACSSWGTTYWTANGINARGQITSESLGNSLVSTRVFDSVTGWLKSIKSGSGTGGSGVQNLEYTWDLVGNLSSRKDLNQSSLTESLTYDNLYRLKTATLSTGPSLAYDYDALGNLMSQTGVGAYTYHSTKKHQVTSTANGWSFGYDANGNMTSGRGASLDWTSYNYPSCIRLGSSCSGTSADYSSFSYTPDRQYWKQQSNYVSGGQATTIYVGGLIEKVTTASGTDYRHMIRAGGSTIIVSRQSSGTNSTYYVTSDHLGSSSAITNGSGGILVNSSFDAFGKRRGASWTGSPSAGDWTAIAGTTRRGFTEHSMLDNLNLTHMNGRVYDPMVGRFMSADPYITEPFNTQNYNRYSYVLNNPLSVLDPTGFWQVGIGWPGEIAWSTGCQADTRFCWNPFRGHFDDNVFSHFVSDSRNARHGGREFDGPSGTWVPDSSAKDSASWSANGRPQAGKYGKEIGRIYESICYEAGCVDKNGQFWIPGAQGIESVSWSDPVVLLGAYGASKGGCTGDCQTSVLLGGAVLTRSRSLAKAAARASTPVGRRTTIMPQADRSPHTPQHVNPPYQRVQNAPGSVNGVNYSGHAFDQMRNRGLVPSVVENALRTGTRTLGNTPGTTVFTDATNSVRVITNAEGRVITVE